ncbi:MAG: hypothetical protein K2G45_03845, partial [Lachnospiraceae bacterium]|nr:hypothetical protein [Lachnospiraceae bacterium]
NNNEINEKSKKEKKKKKRKFPLLLLVLLMLIVAAVLYFGNGGGLGFGLFNNKEAEKTTEADTTEKVEENIITIEVKQGQYFIDGKEVTLTDIEQIIKENDAEHTKYVMDDNYAGTQSWDELKALFSNQGITPVMEE